MKKEETKELKDEQLEKVVGGNGMADLLPNVPGTTVVSGRVNADSCDPNSKESIMYEALPLDDYKFLTH